MKYYAEFQQSRHLFLCQSSAWIKTGFQSEPFPMTKSVLVNCWAEIRVTVKADEMDGECSREPISTGNATHWPGLDFRSCSCLKHSENTDTFFSPKKQLASIFFSSQTVWHFSQIQQGKVQNCSIQQPCHPREHSLPLVKISPFSGGK